MGGPVSEDRRMRINNESFVLSSVSLILVLFRTLLVKGRTTKDKAGKLDETREMETKENYHERKRTEEEWPSLLSAGVDVPTMVPGIDSELSGQLNMKLMSYFIRLIRSNTSSQ